MQRDHLTHAFEHYNAGRLDEAERGCRMVLAAQPGHMQACHLLGVICFREGNFSEARDFLARAIKIGPPTAEMYNNYGAVLNVIGELNSAVEAFRRALTIDPDYPWALNNLGCIYRDTKRTSAAIEAFRRAFALKPDFAEAEANLRSAYRDMIPPWHFAMMHDRLRNDVYESAINRACAGRRVLEIGTGAGLLAMMAARAGAKHVTTCEAVGPIAEQSRVIIGQNRMQHQISVIAKRSTDLVIGRDLTERAEVLVTETFSSNLLDEGILPTIEDAHQRLLTENAIIIPATVSAMGYLIGGDILRDMLFIGRVKDFDLSPFNEFAPPSLTVGLDGLPHEVLSADVELLRFDLRERQFPMTRRPVTLIANRPGICVGVAAWIKIELDAQTSYGNRPSPDGIHGHWSHMVYRFARPIVVEPGKVVRVIARHDRAQINIDLIGPA